MNTLTITPTLSVIIEASRLTGVKQSKLFGTARTHHVCMVRWACFLALRRSGMRYQDIGLQIGGRDHATVIHGIRRATEYTTTNTWFAILVNKLALHLATQPQP